MRKFTVLFVFVLFGCNDEFVEMTADPTFRPPPEQLTAPVVFEVTPLCIGHETDPPECDD